MPVTNQFERDVVNQAQLKHPGRVDMIVLQNTSDAGDGSPGIQRCFRNYLHQGGMENDIDLLAHGIIGTSVNISNVELQQLSNIGAAVISSNEWLQIANIGTADISANEWSQIANIGAVTINVTQWGYLGASNQPIATTDTPSFTGLALTANLTIAGNSITGTSVNINNAEMQQLSNIGAATINGTQWGYVGALNQGLTQTSNVNFGTITSGGSITAGGTLAMGSNVITTSSTVDGVDVSTHNHSGAGTNGSTIPFTSVTGDVIYAQVNAIVDISGTGNAAFISSADHVHTSSDGSTKVSHANLSNLHQSVTSGSSPNFSQPTVTDIYVAGTIYHTGDTHTFLRFVSNDTFSIWTGNAEIATFVNGGLELGNNGVTCATINTAVSDSDTVLVTGGAVVDFVTLDNAFDKSKIINGATSEANAFQVGGATYRLSIWNANTYHSYISAGTAVISIRGPTGVANDYASLKISDAGLDHHMTLEVEGGNTGSVDAWVAYIHDRRTGTTTKTLRIQTDRATMGTTNHSIEFYDSSALVGRVHSEVVYATFTGSHDSQTDDDALKWEIGMILSSTGKIIGKPTMGRALMRTKLTTERQDKTIFGVFSGISPPGHNFKGFDNKKIAVSVNALGEGMILVTDTNGNIENGDYIQSSPLPGLGEKQDDDILHNYTVAKATRAINWNRIKSKNGIKKKLITCTYHCG